MTSKSRLAGLFSRPSRLSSLVAERREQNNFDLLRLVAALLVLFAHSFDTTGGLEPLTHASWGDLGVVIFFAISGFLVSRSWDYDPHVGQFAVKRALRLLPGLIVAVLVSALVLGPLVSTESASAYFSDPATKAYVLDNATLQTVYVLPGVFAHNIYPSAVNGSLWTLPLEVKVYLLLVICGLIGWATRLRIVPVLFAAYAAVAMFAGGRLWLPGAAHYAAFLTNLQMPAATVAQASDPSSTGALTIFAIYPAAFAIGAALYTLRRWVFVAWPLAIVAFAAIVIATATQVGATVDFVYVFAVPYLVLWVAYRTHRFVRLPRWFGDYSYGIYVYAFPAQQTVSLLLDSHNGWVNFVVALPPTIVAAALSWHFVERPMLQMKRLVGGSTAEQAVPSAEVG